MPSPHLQLQSLKRPDQFLSSNSASILETSFTGCTFRPGIRLFLWVVAVLLTGLLCAGRASATNPQLMAGGSAVSIPVTAGSYSIVPTPTSGSLNAYQWNVMSPGGAVIATNNTPNGWSLPASTSYGTGSYAVNAPAGTTVATGYILVWYGSPSYIGNFDVVPNAPPTAPTSLSAVAGNQYVSLTWTASSGSGVTYSVFRGTAASAESTTAVASGLASPSYIDNSLTNGTTYYYTVKAVNTAGSSSASVEAFAKPQPVAPLAPTGLTATRGNAQVSLSWTAPLGSGLTYSIYRGTATGAESTTAIASGLTTTGYTNTGLTNGTTYYYTVKAVNSFGTSPASGEASATPLAPPAAPTGLTATRGNTQVSLSWTASPGATSYSVYQGTSAGGEAATAIASGLTTTSYTNTGLTNGTTYYYKVTATGSGGEGLRSGEVSATPLAPPAAPQNLVVRAGSGSASLVWTASATATSYNVKRSTSSYGPFTLITGGSVSGTSATDTVLTNGTTYYYEVSASSTAGEGSNSYPAVSVIPGSVTLTAPLLAVTAQNGSNSVQWASVAGATSYNLYRATTAGGEGAVPLVVGAGYAGSGMVFYTDSGLTNSPATTYYYRVAPVSASGESTLSNEASATPGSPPVLPPAPVLKAVGGNAQVTLTWGAVGGAAGYNVYRSGGGSYSSTLIKVGVTGTTFIDTTLTNGTNYTYSVYAVSLNSQGTASNSVSVTPSATATPLPAPLLAVAAQSSSNSVLWAPVTGATSYNLYRSTTAGGEGTVPYVVSAGNSNGGIIAYTDPSTGTLAAGTYYYKVAPVGSSGEGTLSNEFSSTPGATLLTGPQMKVIGGNNQVTLTWGAVSGAGGYNVYRTSGGSSYGAYGTLIKVGVTATTFADTTAVNGTLYTYSVYPIRQDHAGQDSQGTTSNIATAAPATSVTPLSPPLLAVTAQSGSSSLSLQWSNVPGATAYNVYRSTTAGGEGAVPVATNQGSGSQGSGMSSYNDSGLTTSPATTYYYKIVPLGPNGESTPSNEATATPGVTPLTYVSGLTGTAGYGSVTLNWSALTNATNYNVYRNSVLIAVGVSGLTYTDSGPGPGSFSYSVAAVDKDGQGATYGQGGGSSVYISPNDFSLSPSPLTVSAVAGTTGEGDIVITRSGTLTSTPVVLSLSGTLPPGVTYTFFPGAPDHTDSSVLFCVGAGTAAGTYPFTLMGSVPGSPSPLTHSIQVNLTVTTP